MRAVGAVWLVCVCVSFAEAMRREVVVSGGGKLSVLAVKVLQEAGLPARLYPAESSPSVCNLADSESCVHALRERLQCSLYEYDLPCVEMGVLASEYMRLSSWWLQGEDLDYLGDVAPPVRRSCWTAAPDLRAMDDLQREGAERYKVLASTESELKLLKNEAIRGKWNVSVLLAGGGQPTPEVDVVRCGWAQPSIEGLHELAPPVGTLWTPRRVVKLVNKFAMIHLPRALEVLARITLNMTEELELQAKEVHVWKARHADLVREWAHETKKLVLTVAVEGRRMKSEAQKVKKAVQTARGVIPVKVLVMYNACSAAASDALADFAARNVMGGEGALVGPGCGAGLRGASCSLERLGVPLVLYTPAGPDAKPALRTAGDSRIVATAWGAVCKRLGWRRAAILTEWVGRHQADTELLQVDPIHRVDLPDTHDPTVLDPILEWARTSAKRGARVLLVGAEDGRVVRGAVCAGWREGLRPPEVVWLLPPPLWGDWLPEEITVGTDRCSRDELRAALEGHLYIAPAGVLEAGGDEKNVLPLAALLHDTVLFAAAALREFGRVGPEGGHKGRFLRAAQAVNYTGLTGHFSFREDGVRDLPFSIYQWWDGRRQLAGKYVAGSLGRLDLRWSTANGVTPEDRPRCALGALVAALHADCSAGPPALAALILAAVAVLGAAGAAFARRTMRRRYRRRLERAARDSRPPCDARWELPAERVVINRRLGRGSCGTVYGGHAQLASSGAWTAVAVKTLRTDAGAAEKLDFLSETETLKGLEHENVVRLLGLVTRAGPLRAVLELAALGDLRSYLAARRGAEGGAADVAPRTLTRWALEAARALSYLRARRVVHRDVAARNCLLSARRSLRLADFGMARHGADCEQYQLARSGLLPVRWMAPESVSHGVFSPASDVWSLGVLYTEMVSLGALPYAGLHNWQVAERLRAGLAPPAPTYPRLSALLAACWRHSPAERPTAAAIAAFLADRPRLLRAAPDALCLPPPAEPDVMSDNPTDRTSSTATDDTYLSFPEPSDLPEQDEKDTDAFLP